MQLAEVQRGSMSMPVTGIHLHGDITVPGSFVADDLKLIASPAHREKIRKYLKNVPAQVEMHFVNLPPSMLDVSKVHGNHRQSPKPDGYDRIIDFYRNQLYPIGHIDQQTAKETYSVDVKPKTGQVTVLFLENESPDVVKLTPWMVAHRMGHVLYQVQCKEANGNTIPIMKTFSEVIDLFWHSYQITSVNTQKTPPTTYQLAWFFGTTRACREATVVQHSEFWYECFAQFCITGRVRFNTPKKVMHNKKWKLVANPGASMEVLDQKLKILAAKLERHFRWRFHACAGQIYAF